MGYANLQKGFTMIAVVAIVVLAMVIGGVVYFVTRQEPSINETIEKDNAMMDKENNDMMDGKIMPSESQAGMMKYSGAILAGTSAVLLDFTKADYDAALNTDKLIVLYFYANWCPICRAEFPIMQKAFNELNTDKAVGFRVNYNDSETDNDEKNLARQFGVAYQHTKVFIKNGRRILKSPESWDNKRYHAEIGKALTQ
ncbi:MAG: hypothetical protein A3A98_00075 [Candidatus Staskawiczbacteria bacterium RIFCSPLOWO2_01_FULL_40_39]|uniref:Thioredoxin domain-containing protein n=1 Tax=Candidatus Staskawiczbacteria bacterium RIFCSPHIGHO2_01_FULL_39_25 TaxID=1802202 RepID=A0A1G2HMM1_9BACT|nr:MAG: hypothetical protein A2730_00075 [Candidatus Staskawiczbacteria bacterium RIFCSPHIGHO2_01_FULL_39_25]OGZ73142.1 MAG: hypothetical protein A3A98_00075 [Candidatus Staskawiczbacteria bacterium RIFCSPLOWO2_01_FULL_40_39]OGZ76824.1 MAG: hypothetical protein A3I87_03110 [Candidatus Staskawiczbacteria bacterium RIFCSPLOWO2_02_FULL_39_8]